MNSNDSDLESAAIPIRIEDSKEYQIPNRVEHNENIKSNNNNNRIRLSKEEQLYLETKNRIHSLMK